MRNQRRAESVDVVIGTDGKGTRLITISKKIADHWPDIYRPAYTKSGALTAEAKRAADTRNVKPEPINDPDDLPSAPNPATTTVATDTTAGAAGVTTEGVTS